jgi:hypothetical protein
MSLTTLHDIGVALKAYLVANGCPLVVVDGPENAKTAVSFGIERVVLEQDTDGKDTFADPRGMHRNAKHRYTATEAFKATIYVQSRESGAQTFEHQTRAKLARETVIAGLELVAAVNKNRFKPTTGGFVTPADLATSEQPGGAAYELQFTYELPIRAVTFVAGEARPEGLISALSSTTKISNPNSPSDEPETACGA